MSTILNFSPSIHSEKIIFTNGKILSDSGNLILKETETVRWFNGVVTNYIHFRPIIDNIFWTERFVTTSRIGNDDWEHYSTYIGIIDVNNLCSAGIVYKEYIKYDCQNEAMGEALKKIFFLNTISSILNPYYCLRQKRNKLNVKDLSFFTLDLKDVRKFPITTKKYSNLINEGLSYILILLLRFHISDEIISRRYKKQNLTNRYSFLGGFSSSTYFEPNKVKFHIARQYYLKKHQINIYIFPENKHYRIIIKSQNLWDVPIDYKVHIRSVEKIIQSLTIECHDKYKEMESQLLPNQYMKILKCDDLKLIVIDD